MKQQHASEEELQLLFFRMEVENLLAKTKGGDSPLLRGSPHRIGGHRHGRG